MPIENPPNSPPTSESGTLLYKLGREWCIGDTVKVFNNNFTNLDNRADLLSTNLFFGLSSHVYRFNAVDSTTIDLVHNTSLNRLSANVLDNSIDTSKLGGNILQAGKTLLTAVSLSALSDIKITNIADNQVLVYSVLSGAWTNATIAVGEGGGGGGTGTGSGFPPAGDYKELTVGAPYTEFNSGILKQDWLINQNAITSNKIKDGEVGVSKLSTGAPSWATNSNVAIGGVASSASTNKLTVIGNISASGSVFGNFGILDLTTKAGNLSGGTAGQIPYQLAVGNTEFISIGTAGQLLQSAGTGTPTWISPSSLTVNRATSATAADGFNSKKPLLSDHYYRLLMQTGEKQTELLAAGTSNQYLQLISTVEGGLTVQKPTWTTLNLSTVPNLASGAAGQIPYQSAANTTLFTAAGTSGQLLQSNGTGAPTWISPGSITNIKAAELSGGLAGQIPYQTGPNATEFITAGTSGQVLKSNGAGTPTWISQSQLVAGSASTATNATLADDLNITTRGILYQNGSSDTTVASFGTKAGAILTQGTSTAGVSIPVFTDPDNITVGKAKAVGGGLANQLLKQSAVGVTEFVENATTIGHVLTWSSSGPKWDAAATPIGTSTNLLIKSLGVGTAAATSSTTSPLGDGEIRATGDITAFYTSDIRLKENIKPLINSLENINQINGVSFDWKDDFIQSRGGEDNYFMRKHDVGVIAQEVQKIIPEAVAERVNGQLAVRYEKIIPLLIEAIKELSQKVRDLENK